MTGLEVLVSEGLEEDPLDEVLLSMLAMGASLVVFLSPVPVLLPLDELSSSSPLFDR